MDRAATSLPSSAATTRASSPKRLNVFERYLSLWVGLRMVVGVVLGLTAPGMMQGLRSLGSVSVQLSPGSAGLQAEIIQAR